MKCLKPNFDKLTCRKIFKLIPKIHTYINIDCVSESLFKSFEGGPSYRKLSTCSVKVFLKYINLC